MIDCGLFQGLGYETHDLNSHFGFQPASVKAMVLTHAHIDHSGLIPRLVKEGFSGKIYCTEATRDLAEILLYDSAEIQTYEIDIINKRRASRKLPPYKPLYDADDVAAAVKLFEPIEYNKPFHISPTIQARFIANGHLVGSAALHLEVSENGKTTRIHFTGDVGRYNSVLLCAPEEFPQADYIVCESTYGNKRHDLSFSVVKNVRQWLEKTCLEKGGKLIIPAFSVGRTQEILYALNQLEVERRLPELKYFVDSPLSMKATTVLKKYTHQFNERLQQVLETDDDPFHFEGLKYVESVEDSKRLVDYEEPCVIISASGTADAGRVRHHIRSCIHDAKNTILFAGYCGAKSLGGILLSGTDTIELMGDDCEVKAEIGKIEGMSAHADCDELGRYLSCQDPDKVKKIFLVHGEHDAQENFVGRLEVKGFKRVHIPDQHEYVELD